VAADGASGELSAQYLHLVVMDAAGQCAHRCQCRVFIGIQRSQCAAPAQRGQSGADARRPFGNGGNDHRQQQCEYDQQRSAGHQRPNRCSDMEVEGGAMVDSGIGKYRSLSAQRPDGNDDCCKLRRAGRVR